MFCDCPNDPYGGLSERVTLIRDLRKKTKQVLLLDSGNMVSLFGDYDLKASSVLRLMNLMGYDAALVGRNEFYRGCDRTLKMKAHAQFPLINATIAKNGATAPLFEEWILSKKGTLNIAVAAISDDTSLVHVKKDSMDFDLIPVSKALGQIISDMKTASDAIIIMSQMEHDKNIALMSEFPDIDLIVEGHGNKTFDPPVKAGNGFIVSPGNYGQHVGSITLDIENGTSRLVTSELIPVLDIPEDKSAHKIVVEYYRDRK